MNQASILIVFLLAVAISHVSALRANLRTNYEIKHKCGSHGDYVGDPFRIRNCPGSKPYTAYKNYTLNSTSRDSTNDTFDYTDENNSNYTNVIARQVFNVVIEEKNPINGYWIYSPAKNSIAAPYYGHGDDIYTYQPSHESVLANSRLYIFSFEGHGEGQEVIHFEFVEIKDTKRVTKVADFKVKFEWAF